MNLQPPVSTHVQTQCLGFFQHPYFYWSENRIQKWSIGRMEWPFHRREQLVWCRILCQAPSWYHRATNVCVELKAVSTFQVLRETGQGNAWSLKTAWMDSVSCAKNKWNALFRAKQDLGEWIYWDFWNCGLWIDGIQLLFIKIKPFLSRLCKLAWSC